jgi:hypothetical protein
MDQPLIGPPRRNDDSDRSQRWVRCGVWFHEAGSVLAANLHP